MIKPINKDKIIGQTITDLLFDKKNPYDIGGESTLIGLVLSNGEVLQLRGFKLWDECVVAAKIQP